MGLALQLSRVAVVQLTTGSPCSNNTTIHQLSTQTSRADQHEGTTHAKAPTILVLPSVRLESLCAGTQNVQRLSLNCEKCYLLALSRIFWTNCNLPATPQVLTLFTKCSSNPTPRHKRSKHLLVEFFSDDLISSRCSENQMTA